MPLSGKTSRAIKLAKENKEAAVILLDTIPKIYPEFVTRNQVIKHDTIKVAKVEFKTVFKDRAIVDSVALKKMVAAQINALTAMDSLKFLIADRDLANRILTRTAMNFINDRGLITKDTLVKDTLGIRMKVYVVKNTLIAELRQAEKKLAYEKTVNQTDVKPAYIERDWWSFWETWVSVGFNLLLISVISVIVTRVVQRKG
jgi:hypothetical protein